jgi:hypothetical protein
MKREKEKYLKELMQKYNVSYRRNLDSVMTAEEYDKLVELELQTARGL